MATRDGTPRQRYREQVRAEIKEAALAQIGVGGAGALSLNAVAKQLGVTGPALYKYFRSRDDLLTELISDGYDAAAAAVRAAAERTAGRPPRERLHALAATYREWAVAAPHLYQLLAGTPSPGYEAPPETVDRARAVLGPFLPVVAQGRLGPAADRLAAQMRQWADDTPAVAEWVRAYAPGCDAATALAGTVALWARLHGVVDLEVQGQFTGMGHQPATLLEAEMESFADTWGLS
ncbi:TetR/AcrR family transcriptional regulator [Sphaerisporangium perillae]|uniref:TetR/AcrR family transcriptional regulator n=1 Tax=Sphaerisporangium perillae TaxID=2935860 RepID=UPI00200D158E|nr:TetR/AcrR family transcriptional regulator [Sphaerisporangium perillae]